MEQLESRNLLTLLGNPFDLQEQLEASGLSGALSATIHWGDGEVSVGEIVSSGRGRLTARIDYSLDDNGFFDMPERRLVFEQAVDTVISRLDDDLSAIIPVGSNSWQAVFFHPATGETMRVPNLTINENELLIYVGGRDLGGSLGTGGPGGYSVSGSSSFIETVKARGEEGNTSGGGAKEFAPWGGSITFNPNTQWHVGLTTEGLDSDESDLYSVAIHEVAHVLGVGTSQSWTTWTSNRAFIGPLTLAEYDYGGSVPLSADLFHWADGVADGGSETAMDPTLQVGTRKVFTALDYAALDDLGWDVLTAQATVSATHVYSEPGVYNGAIVLTGIGGDPLERAFQVIVRESLTESWQNPGNRFDVDGNGAVEPLDALKIVNNLNRYGIRILSEIPGTEAPPFVDVNGDGNASPADALDVVNELNRQGI